ncbi:MAG TPA: hypothetical protein VFB60_15700 [Ktedonobacteraceae bacterium]|nr:hypothetical protein [Ktedonobacteraceae bacterium]
MSSEYTHTPQKCGMGIQPGILLGEQQALLPSGWSECCTQFGGGSVEIEDSLLKIRFRPKHF